MQGVSKVCQVIGVLSVLLGSVVSIWWLNAAIRNDPQKSSSDAEYVAEYVQRRGGFTDEQLDIIWDGVNEAHGDRPWIRFVPWLYPPYLCVSGLVLMFVAWDIRSSIQESNLQTKAAEPGATDNPDDAQRLREDH